MYHQWQPIANTHASISLYSNFIVLSHIRKSLLANQYWCCMPKISLKLVHCCPLPTILIHVIIILWQNKLLNEICLHQNNTGALPLYSCYLYFKPGVRRPQAVHAWFLKIVPVQIVGMHACVCVSPFLRLLITSGMIWHDMDLIQLVKQVLHLLYSNCSHYR